MHYFPDVTPRGAETPGGRRVQIESGVPIPPRSRGKWKAVAAAMKAGDSVLCLTKSESKRLVAALYLMNGRPTQRTCEGGIRVWRNA